MPPFTGDGFQEPKPSKSSLLLTVLAWLVALSLVTLAALLGWRYITGRQSSSSGSRQVVVAQAALPQKKSQNVSVSLPAIIEPTQSSGVNRKALLHTIIPNRPDLKVETYTVEKGDALFEIAAKYKIKPETILWANYDQLNDNPDMISVGMVLNIPPVNGVYYQWQKGDTIQSVAGRFDAKADDILDWAGNQADLTNPAFNVGTWVMVPNGHREFRQWLIPVIPRGRAGVSKSVYGAGACEGGYEGAYGSGAFVWPAGNHSLSGNDYWSGHLGIDIAAGEGAPVYAADSGVVVFAGWATGGYGNMIMIDHGNGYQTLYGHLSQVSISCGRSVGQGQTIGYAGSTGNSTGAHLHFEVRFQGGFVDPWYVLPAP
jgi:murein DD-endopeptidase MepM/ murein hydrolase activator NlpD